MRNKTLISKIVSLTCLISMLAITPMTMSGIVIANDEIKNNNTEFISEQPPEAEFAVDKIIVKYKEGTSDETISMVNSKNGIVSAEKIIKNNPNAVENENAEIFKKHGLDRIYILKISKGNDAEEQVKRFNKESSVEYAELDYKVDIDSIIPDDEYFSSLWGIHNTVQTGGTPDADIDAPEAWSTTTGSSDVVVAVIDTGVDYNHEDLSANMWTNDAELNGIAGNDDDGNGYTDDIYGYDFINIDSDPYDDHGHGTHCSGTIAGVGNNGIGVAGVSWNAKVMALKFLGLSGGYTSDAVLAINYAVYNGADVMSNSWGGGGYSEALKDAIIAANDAGVLFIASSGNSGMNTDSYPHYPSSYDIPNVISVAATDSNDNLAYFSNYGATTVELGAPGVNTYSTMPGNSYDYKSGTSMAAPHVSGAVALIMAQYPTLTKDEIKMRLLVGVDEISSLDGKTVTGGRLNVNNSLEDDTVSPSAVNNLAAGDSTLYTTTLTWTATGDDGSAGTAKIYDIRYSITAIDDTNWDSATQVTDEPAPQVSGVTESHVIMGLSHSTTYYFAMKALDNLNNSSGLSNIASETTIIPETVFSDDMESGENGWTHSGVDDNWELGAPTSGPGIAYSGVNVWATDLDGHYYENYINASLQSPTISLNGFASSYLMFQHHYETWDRYDGCIVEISTNEGVSWTQITPTDGYPEDAVSSYNPLGAVPAYSGYSGDGWSQAIFDISEYDGYNEVNVRFRFGSASSLTGYDGWYIDDVSIIGMPDELNILPIADANGPYSGTEDVSLTFNGSGSYDPEGNELTYLWDFGDGTTGIGISPTHTYTAGGEYTVTMKVNDGKANSLPATTVATITEINDVPVADAGSDQEFNDWDGTGLESVTLDGQNSYDFDGDEITYLWTEGETILSEEPIFTDDFAVGAHNITLTVTDIYESFSTASVTVTVNPNQAPVANAGYDLTGLVNRAITFNGLRSSDVDGTTLSYNWNFGDGTTGAGANPTHTYTEIRDYEVTLRVTDEGGLEDTDILIATVEKDNTIHVSNIEMVVEEKKSGSNTFSYVTTTVTIVDLEGKILIEGATVSGRWSGLTSSLSSSLTDENGEAAITSSYVKNASGTFTFTVTNVVLDGWQYYPSENEMTSVSVDVS